LVQAALDAKSFIPEVVPLLIVNEPSSSTRVAILLDGLQSFGMKRPSEVRTYLHLSPSSNVLFNHSHTFFPSLSLYDD
jgi:hypothetical protein